jgi:predicted CXXCH cytochrome family protein
VGTPTATELATQPIPTAVPATASPTPTPTASASASPTPTATPTAFVPDQILDTQLLWATAQTCTAGPIVDPANSIDLAFNDLVASCGPFADGDSWTYVALQDTTFSTVAQATLEVRFYATGLTNDLLSLEVNDGLGWQEVDTFEATNPPPGSLTTLVYDLSATFGTPVQVDAAQVRFLLGQRGPLDSVTLSLDEAALRIVDVVVPPTPFPPLPTPTAPPPEPTEIPGPGDPHVDYDSTTASCAGCHRAHTSPGRVLRQAWPEEDLCFYCHTAGGPGTDVQGAFVNYANTLTRFFKHDVAATAGVHYPGEGVGDDFGGGNRHVECEDCHEPHEATRGPAPAPMLQREMHFRSGVDPAWTAPGAPASFAWLPQAEREYQVCFKCHSSFTTLPSYLPDGWDGTAYVADGLSKLTSSDPSQIADSRDLAQEFNPYQASFHPVIAVGRNQTIPAGSFVSGWSQSSMTYCSDCHTNANAATEGNGPHGSPHLHLLDGGSDYSTVYASGSRVDSGEICFKCHDYDAYVSGLNPATNFDHERHLNNNRGTTCYTCHDSHGSEQLHLLNFEAAVITFLDGRDSQTAWYRDSSGQAGCYLECHGRRHDPATYTSP